MRKASFLLLILSLAIIANGQNTINFQLKPPTAKMQQGLYNRIKIIDMRHDTVSMGMVKVGFFDKKTIVKPKPSLPSAITNYFYQLADTSGKTGELVLLLRRCGFAVVTIGTRDYGNFALRANLLSFKNGQYQQIAAIDTIAIVSSAMTVTDTLFNSANKIIGQLLGNNLSATPASTIYSYYDVLHIDSLEKLTIKLYNTGTYTDGLYLTYKSFMNQKPDKQITVELNDVNNGTVRAIDPDGKTPKVKPQKVYALVFRGQPYISSRGMYYPLKKEGNDFYFTGEMQTGTGIGTTILTSSFGLLGTAIGMANAEDTFYVRIDHLTGQFIPIKRIADVPVASSQGE